MSTSQFFGLNIAASGLRASNAALNTTANNISNVNTTGYSRQKVTQQAANPLQVFAKYGSAGAGVETLSIERVRDEFYDEKYRTNNSLYGQNSAQKSYNDLIQTYLNDDGTTGFSSLFNKMQASLQSVMTAAGTTEAKSTFVSNVQAITDYFNTVSNNLKNEQEDINSEIKLDCDRISAIAQELATINKQINITEMTGAHANQLRDQRDNLIDELSKMVSVETKESAIVDVNDPDRETGATRYQVWIAGGQELVDTYEYRKLVCIARDTDEKINQNDIDGIYDVKWASSKYKDGDPVSELSTFDLSNANMGGELQGLAQMRDGNNAQYFHGSITSMTDTSTDPATAIVDDATMAAAIRSGNATITINVSDSYLKDMTKATLPADGYITLGGKQYKYDSWEYDGGSEYTLKLDPISPTYTLPQGTQARIGKKVDYQGIPYYQEQMNEWIRQYSAEVNKIMVGGYTSDSQQGVMMLTGNNTTDSASQYSYDELTSLSRNKGYYNVTASNFSVNSVLAESAEMLATKADMTEGDSEYRNLTNLNKMINTQEIFRGATSGEFLTKVLADVSLNAANSDTLEKTYAALEKTIANERLAIAGVDEDEEAKSLIEYQNAYTLSSKMISTLTEIYDRLILQTGV